MNIRGVYDAGVEEYGFGKPTVLSTADLQNSADLAGELDPSVSMRRMQDNFDEATGRNDFEGRYSHMRNDLLDEAAKDLR